MPGPIARPTPLRRPARRAVRAALLVLVWAAAACALAEDGADRADPALATVPATRLAPFYPVAGEGAHAVPAFEMQVLPVTNADYLAFVRTHPEWAKDAPPEVFANPAYLAHWAGPHDLGDAHPDAPVSYVSWFAAAAYCDAAGLRLPSEDEWEVAARADHTRTDASGDRTRTTELMAIYASRSSDPVPVGHGLPNAFGIQDLHEGVWEWVEDPWASITQADSRNAGDVDVARVCGGASIGARDRTDYPAFMRYAMRTSLSPASAAAALGFRCAR